MAGAAALGAVGVPVVSGPKLEPRAKLEPVKTYLPPGMKEELDSVSEFQSAAFALMGTTEKVSRNDVVVAFLRWALDSFWADKGGVPLSEEDRHRKARQYVAALKKSQANHK